MSKTIETHLQSNEVRIPKKQAPGFDVSSAAAPCQYFKSSFARSLSFSQSGCSPYGTTDQHFTRSLDFEVNFGLSPIPDQPSGAGAGCTSSSQTTPSVSPVFDPERDLGSDKTKLANGIPISSSSSGGGVVKTLWSYAKGTDVKSTHPGGTPIKLAAVPASGNTSIMPSGSSSSPSTRKSVEANEIEVLRLRKECQNLIEENRRLVNLAANSGYAINGVMNGGGSGHGAIGVGSTFRGPSTATTSGNSSLTTLGLGLTGGGTTGATAAEMFSNVETVILQTQVETLQWQLKQVDSSRQMYRAVMEEVVRYLDRCYRSLDALQPGLIGRSKSVLQVSSKPASICSTSTINNTSSISTSNSNNHDSDSSSASSPRARSSTNLSDVQKSYAKKQQGMLLSHQTKPVAQDDDCPPPSPASSYSTFRDFTWRRSPKRTQTLPISCNEVEPEKLAQEAFRLLRTVQNLLNTQEPVLSQPAGTGALDGLLLMSTPIGSTTGSTSTLTGNGVSTSSPSPATSNHHHHHLLHHHHVSSSVDGLYPAMVNTRSNVGFTRKINMRGSRLSLRSSTDDSVHSTSSSNKTETDEDNMDRPSPPLSHHLHHHPHTLIHQHQNSASSSSSSTTSSNSGHLINHRHSANIERIKEMMIPSSSAEDESGFSSMNSFQEIGLPLVNSTMVSSSAASSATGVCLVDSTSSAASSTGSVSFVSDESSDMRENTVIPSSNVTTIAINSSPSTTAKTIDSNSGKPLTDKLGIPSPAKVPEIPARVTQTAAYEHHNHFINHRRWDSAPVVPPKLKIHHHSGDSDGGVSSRVLWV